MSDDIAELTGDRDLDKVIQLFKLTADELMKLKSARPGDPVTMHAIAQRLVDSRGENVIRIVWGTA